MNFNQTLIKAFACPRRGHLLAQRMEKQPHGLAAPGPARVGQAVHRFIMDYFTACRKLGRQTDLAAGAEIARNIETIFDLREWTADFAGICDQVMVSEMAPLGGCVMERMVRVVGGDGVAYFGTPDMVIHLPGVLKIDDWKTNRRIPTQAEIEADIQLPFYAYLHWLIRDDIDRYELSYHYVRYGVIRTFSMTADQVELFGERIRKRTMSIEGMTDFPALPGEACTYCEDSRDCPAAVEPGSGASREERAGRLRAMKRTVQALEKDLKADVEANGPIDINGETLDFWPVEKKTFIDTRPVFDALLEADVSPDSVWAALNLGQADAKRLCKGDKKLWKRIEELASRKTETRFQFKGEE